MVVLQDLAVQSHVDVAAQRRVPALASDGADAVAGQRPDRGQGVRVLPGVVDQPHVSEAAGAFLAADAYQGVQPRLGQWRVGAQGDQERQLAGPVERVDQRAEQRGQRQAAGVVGDQDQDALAVVTAGEGLVQRLPDGGGVQGGARLGDGARAHQTPPKAS